MAKAPETPKAPTIKYLSINGPSALERLPAGQKSILLLDANVFAYLLTHRKNATAYSFSNELHEMLRLVHRRQIRVDASFAAMERALGASKLIASPEDFAHWFDDFYEGKALFKVDTLKPATGPLGTPMNFAVAAYAWEGTFLPAYATLLKAMEIATKRPKKVGHR